MSSATTNSLTSLKLSFNGEIRRLSVATDSLTYPDLMAKTLSVFPHLTSIQFSWVDDEDDNVVISSSEELSEALRIMASENKGYLRFEVLATSSRPTEATQTQATESRSVPAPTATFGTITHAGIVCDGCGASPLTGPRFKCSVRDNYDVCATCEASVPQPYPMVKIYRPEQVPAGIMVIVDEDRTPHRCGRFRDPISPGDMCHRGISCNGCRTRNFHGPRFKCSVRDDYDLCEACEGKDSHEYVMVKIYPQHARMHIQVVPNKKAYVAADVLPYAAAQFRQSLFGLLGRGGRHGPGSHGPPHPHGPHPHGPPHHGPPHHGPHHAPHHHGPHSPLHCGPGNYFPDGPSHHHGPPAEEPVPPHRGRGGCRNGGWRKSEKHGGHCWDRASVARAAAARALHHATVKEEEQRVHKAKEDARLEEELLDMCIQQSLQEKEMLTSSDALSSATTVQSEPDIESSNEEKTDEKGEKTTLLSLAAHSEPPAPLKLMARFVRDVTMPDGSEIAPYSTFFKTWRVRNDGKGAWPEGCHLVSAGGDRLLDPKLGEDFVLRQPVPATAAGEEVELTLELCAPEVIGRHVGYFRLQSPDGGYFGQRLWADIRVHADDMSVSMTLVPWEVLDSCSDSLEVKEEQTDITSNVDPTTEEAEQTTEQGTSLTNEDERDRLLDNTPLLQEQEQHQEQEQKMQLEQEKQLEQDFDAAVNLWSKELRVLSAMGFHDLEQLLPLLQTHIQVPASQQEKNGTQEPGSETGLQAVVLALLSGQE